ncbi:MAG: ATP-binding protein [Dehalococcoidia bacterium]
MEAESSSNQRELETLQTENQRLRGLLSLLADLNLRITSSLDLPTVLQDVVDAACELTGARYGALAVFDANSQLQQFMTYGISREEEDQIGSRPQGLGILGWLQELQEPLRLADLGAHPKSTGFPANHPTMKTFLGAPLRFGEERLGNLYLTEKAGGAEFTAEDETLLVHFATQAATAIHNAQLHQRAEAERQRLGVLVDTSPVGVFVCDAATGQVLLVNQEAQRILGLAYSSQDHLQRYETAATYLRPDGSSYETQDLPLQRALQRGETVRAEEVKFIFADGRQVPTLVNATPVYSAEGKITAAIAVIQDITPLEEMEQLRSEFLGIVSHELRTPLTSIKGSAATVLGSRRPLNDVETREFFQIIDEQADRLRDLVDNLLDMTRIEAGSLSVTTEPVELGEIFQDAEATFIRNGGVQELRLSVPEDLPPANVDRRRVTQVMNNLLSNAAKFSPATAPVFIEVSYDAVHLTVRVRDQGRGIPEDKLTHLFQKFSQVHDDGHHNLSGSGLGLAICKGIVEAHGGRIWAESPGEGQGTAFSFTLPVAHEQPLHATAETSQRDHQSGRVRRPGERTKVLAVDDEARILRFLQHSLEGGGYQVITTSDSSAVTGLVEMEEPDLVLLDLMLAGANGLELMQHIREFSGVPVIFVTARESDEDMVQALRMGADDYITKPFSPSELLARIEAVLRRRVLPDQIEVRPPFALEDLRIDFTERRVIVGAETVSLSATEYKVLYELATHSGLVLTHDQILHRVWGPEYSGETELIRSFIRNLRRKLGDDARNPRYIFTEPQVGYRMPRP